MPNHTTREDRVKRRQELKALLEPIVARFGLEEAQLALAAFTRCEPRRKTGTL